MQVHCPTCKSPIRSDDMNLSNMVAKCRDCHALFALGPLVARESPPPLAHRVRPTIPTPTGYTIDDADGLQINRRWFTPMIVFLAFFCIAWDAFLIFWYFLAFTMNGPWIMKVFPIVHVAVGLALTYYVLASLLNTTTLLIRDGVLQVRHAPLPWWGQQSLPSDEIAQVFVQQDQSYGRHGRVQFQYSVSAVMKSGLKMPILTGLPDADQAQFVEQRIESYLGITDQPVAGELPR